MFKSIFYSCSLFVYRVNNIWELLSSQSIGLSILCLEGLFSVYSNFDYKVEFLGKFYKAIFSFIILETDQQIINIFILFKFK